MENEKILSAEEVLQPSREACFTAMKRIAAIEGVTVHAGVTITVDITAYTHVFQSEESRAIREKIYEAEAELINAHPGVLFNFKVR